MAHVALGPQHITEVTNAVKELHQTIELFNEASNKSARRMLQLTWAITFLTLAMLILVAVQIGIAMEL